MLLVIMKMRPLKMFLNSTIWQYIMQIQHIYAETVFCSSLRRTIFEK